MGAFIRDRGVVLVVVELGAFLGDSKFVRAIQRKRVIQGKIENKERKKDHFYLIAGDRSLWVQTYRLQPLG